MEMTLNNGFCEMSCLELIEFNGGSEDWNISLDGFTVNGMSVSWGAAVSGAFVGAGVGGAIGGIPGMLVGGVAGCVVSAIYDSF